MAPWLSLTFSEADWLTTKRELSLAFFLLLLPLVQMVLVSQHTSPRRQVPQTAPLRAPLSTAAASGCFFFFCRLLYPPFHSNLLFLLSLGFDWLVGESITCSIARMLSFRRLKVCCCSCINSTFTAFFCCCCRQHILVPLVSFSFQQSR